MSFLKWHTKLYPLVALFASLFIIIFGLVIAKQTLECLCFLLGAMIWLTIFGCGKAILKSLPSFIIVVAIFFGIGYAATGNYRLSYSMITRFGAVFLAIAPGMSTEPVRMTRSLSQVRTPRAVTLGMLIVMSFMPMLRIEIKRVREAMKTRGAGSVLNPKIFYRAFLVPFIMRLVNISDMLSLSVETRGFSLSSKNYSIYHKEDFVISDLIFLIGLLTGAILAVVL